MSMVVNHNIPALSTYNVVNQTSNSLQKSINKLSTGLRINSAADDAAGLAISEKMRAQIKGLDQAVGNAQDGISLIQTAEGALNETHSILQRMRELSVQAANDTLTQQDRSYIQEEVDQLRDEITRIGNTTQFNKKKLLNGDSAALWSSSDDATKAIIRGGLRTIDKFGQKSSVEGNYKINIKAEAGQGEVQKSDIFTIKHANSTSREYVNHAAGVNDISVNSLPAADYTVKSGTAGQVDAAAAKLTGVFGVSDSYTGYTQDITIGGIPAGMGNFVVTVGANTYTAGTNGGLINGTGALRSVIKSAAAAAGLTVVDSGATLHLKGSKEFSTSTTGSGAKATGTGDATTAAVTAAFTDVINASADDDELKVNASVLFEVTDVDTTAGTVTVKASANKLGTDGSISNTTVDGIVLKAGSTTGTNLGAVLGLGGDSSAFNLKLTSEDYTVFFHKGDKFTYNLSPKGTGDEMAVTVHGDANGKWPDGWSNSPARDDLRYTIDADKVGGKDLQLQHYYLNENTGEVMEGSITLTTDADKFNKDNSAAKTLTTFHANYVGETANGGTKLRDLDKFWNSEGKFMLEDPQTITINQGDGKSAQVTLYASDTLDDVAKKLNNAIANDLGQAKYIDNGEGVDKFVTFTSDVNGDRDVKANTSQSVAGTFLIRSLVPGSNGELRFAGDEGVINAFSLNTIQDAKESKYTASITDAHTGESIASNVQVTGNKLIGVINENVDVEFDPMIGVKAKWNEDQKKFSYSTTAKDTTLHLADNTTVFQIGANEGEDMGINIGDMRSHALGLDEVLVTDRDSAARSITVIDNAIDRVSMQRSKLGAYQNRLEHTVNNLTTSSENLTAAESRIRDTDMAKEMLNFSKLQIMLQAGNSMLAQANQLPQNVLSLIR